MAHQTLIRRHDVERLTGFGKAYLYKQMKAGTFPRPVRIGPKAVRWIEAEVRDWILERISEDREQLVDPADG